MAVGAAHLEARLDVPLCFCHAGFKPFLPSTDRHCINGFDADDDLAESLISDFDSFRPDDFRDDAGDGLTLDVEGQAAFLFQAQFD
jgi:hypothetical protein